MSFNLYVNFRYAIIEKNVIKFWKGIEVSYNKI